MMLQNPKVDIEKEIQDIYREKEAKKALFSKE